MMWRQQCGSIYIFRNWTRLVTLLAGIVVCSPLYTSAQEPEPSIEPEVTTNSALVTDLIPPIEAEPTPDTQITENTAGVEFIEHTESAKPATTTGSAKSTTNITSSEESSVTPEQRQAWLDDWNHYWLNYEPTSPGANGTDTVSRENRATEQDAIPPDQAMYEEMTAAVAAENDPNAIHRKIYAHFLDDPKNQKIILFCAVCTILIMIGIRLIIRRRMELRRQRNNSISNNSNKLEKERKL